MDSSLTLLVKSDMVMYCMVSPQTLPCGILSYGLHFVVDFGQGNARSVSWNRRSQYVDSPGFWVRLGLSRLFPVCHRGFYTGQELVKLLIRWKMGSRWHDRSKQMFSIHSFYPIKATPHFDRYTNYLSGRFTPRIGRYDPCIGASSVGKSVKATPQTQSGSYSPNLFSAPVAYATET